MTLFKLHIDSVQVTHILMRRCNPASKLEKPEAGVVEGSVMLAGREPAGHGHSHAIPTNQDSGFEVSWFALRPHPSPRQLSEVSSWFLPSLYMPCLRGSQWAWQTIQSKTKSPPFFLVSDQCGCSSLRSLLTSTSSPSASVCSLSPVGFLPSSGRSGIHCSAQSPSRWPAYYWLRLLPTLIYNWTYSPASSTSPHLPWSPPWERASASSYQRLWRWKNFFT